MNFENAFSNNTKNVNEELAGEENISESSKASLAAIEANAQEISAMNEEVLAEKMADPEKGAKIKNMLNNLKEYAMIAVAAGSLVGSAIYHEMITTDNLDPDFTHPLNSPQAISTIIMTVSTFLTILAVMKKSLKPTETKEVSA